MYALEWLTAQSIILTEQMGEKIKHLNKLSAHLCCESKLRTWMNQFTTNSKKNFFSGNLVFQVTDNVCILYINTHLYTLSFMDILYIFLTSQEFKKNRRKRERERSINKTLNSDSKMYFHFGRSTYFLRIPSSMVF